MLPSATAQAPGLCLMISAMHGQVMTVVRGLTARGITICATIHCPPPHTFTLFDRALVMQRGRVVYFGANGQPAIDYFYAHFDKVPWEMLLMAWLIKPPGAGWR